MSFDAILVLGHRLQEGNKPSDDLMRRIDRAAQLYRETGAKWVMPCGGLTPGHDVTEAEVMRDMLTARGVPAEVIRLEDASRITIENVLNAKKLLPEGANVALVTSDYHLQRAMEDVARAGLNATGVAAETPEGEYRDRMYAQEKRISEEMAHYRAMGFTDEEITKEIVKRMKERQSARS